MDTPRTSAYIENAWPVLKQYGYGREDIAQVVRESDYDDGLINERINDMALDAVNGKGWKKVGAGNKALTGNSRPARGTRRAPNAARRNEGPEPRRRTDQPGATRGRGGNLHRPARDATEQTAETDSIMPAWNQGPKATDTTVQTRTSVPEAAAPQPTHQFARAPPAPSPPAHVPQTATAQPSQAPKRSGTWAAKLKPSAAAVPQSGSNCPAPDLSSEPLTHQPRTAGEGVQAPQPEPARPKAACSWAARLRGVKPEEPATPAEPAADQPAVEQVEESLASVPQAASSPPAEDEVTTVVAVEDNHVDEQPPTPAPPMEAPTAPIAAPPAELRIDPPPAEPATMLAPRATEPRRVAPEMMYQQSVPAPLVHPPAQPTGPPRAFDHMAYQYQPHPYPPAAYRMPGYYDYDFTRARAAAAAAPAPTYPAEYQVHPPQMPQYLPRLATAAQQPPPEEAGYDARSYGAPMAESYPYYYQPYDQRRLEYLQHEGAANQSSQTGTREYRDYNAREAYQSASAMPPPSYPRPPNAFRRDFGVPPVYLATAQLQHEQQPPAAPPAQQPYQQYHYPYSAAGAAGYYALYGDARRPRY